MNEHATPRRISVFDTTLRDGEQAPGNAMTLEEPRNKPIFGKYVFGTAAGIHQQGMLSDPSTYEYVEPARFGRERSLLIGRHSGPDGPAAAVMHCLPGAKAPSHLHPGFELIYVLSGELETDGGVYAAGSLLVMPPTSVHAPRSPKGCVGLVVWERPVQVV